MQNAPPETAVAVIVRQQGWFRASVDVTSVSPLERDKINLVPLNPTGAFRSRVLVGRGPLEHDLGPEFLPSFGHGEEPYPVFQTPSVGPKGAGLYARTATRRITATTDDVICLIEISLVQPVQPSFQEEYERASDSDLSAEPAATVSLWLSQARTWLERAIGLYALYQYPLVWEALAIHPIAGLVNIDTKVFRHKTPMLADNFIPFKLNLTGHARDGYLNDKALVDLPRVGDPLHLPLVLLQRALWQRNVQLRFLETFWLLDYLTSQCALADPGRSEREGLFERLEAFIHREHPDHDARLRALKHVILQAPLRERLTEYLRHRSVPHDIGMLARMLRLRNDLAHARPVDSQELAEVELATRLIAREAMRRELVAQGVHLGDPPIEERSA
jgi:hypothetical protein